MFYLTYRPQTIAELDNTQIRTKIENILSATDSIPHALLLVGSKGMGKTSTARIIAKAINCKRNSFAGKPGSFEPCNTCENCVSIDRGSSPDVIEMDAASNRGIDDVRRIIRESSFAPMTGRYRVYIIDEAHMITNDAFNALLKTLEEPPKSVVFILATTNEEKVPATIISRCVKIAYGQAIPADIEHMLHRIAKHEQIAVDDALLKVIVEHADGSFRDAAKILEELTLQHKLTADAAKQYLGVASREALLLLLKKGSRTETMSWIRSFDTAGGNFKRLIEDSLQMLRAQLYLASGIPDDCADMGFTRGELTTLMKLLSEAYKQMRVTPIESLPIEIAIADFYAIRDNSVKRGA